MDYNNSWGNGLKLQVNFSATRLTFGIELHRANMKNQYPTGITVSLGPIELSFDWHGL